MKRAVTENGFTFIELMVVLSIFLIAAGAAFTHFRNSRLATSKLISNLSFQMDFRKATEKLFEKISDGTEIVKPFEGGSLPFFIYRDAMNYTRIVYLVSAGKITLPGQKTEDIFNLTEYIDKYGGTYDPAQRQILFGKVKSITFTTISIGVVVIHLTMLDGSGKELSSILEIPLRNLGSIDG